GREEHRIERMQVVRAEGVDTLGAVVHLVPEAPQPVPTVRCAVVPVMDQLVDEDADRGAAPGAERCAIHQTPLRQQRAPGATRTERHTEYGNRYGECTHPPA